ncbi:ATP synthase F0 subunit A [Mangrovactinospora gilvigrisea]|uniref:ATP synthase subunit a n=1 Tax=Mangrovactinospora gilvigrisea TaxID=1428644 RepID=A0A1J7BDU0_9ACTN|nr:F0F1 ATP synthase subunit A [Mangrovactinospora gilvigrisea]OIV36843.1 ATP synthase F0 subunit A [Mangrovactinospora gilvigrisea]
MSLAAQSCENAHYGNSSGCSFPAPSLWTFIFKPWAHVGMDLNKPMLLSVICMVLIVVFFWGAFAKPKVRKPGKLQLIGEMGLDFVRRGVARDMIGKEGDRYVPYLVSLFFFVWLMNLMAIIPFAQFPVTSVIAFPAGLALTVWVTYMVLTFKRNGFVGGIKNLCVPPDVPLPIYFILTPVEFISNIFFRPFTLAVRLFGNMFAGHLMIVMFSAASWYLLSPSIGALYSGASFVMTIVLTAFELAIQALQAYIFVMLTASYIGQALSEEH